MNITPSTIYWISVLNNLVSGAVILVVLSGIACAFLLFAFLTEYDDDDRLRIKKLLKISFASLPRRWRRAFSRRARIHARPCM